MYDLNGDLRGNWNDPELPHLERSVVFKEPEGLSPRMGQHWVNPK